VARGERSEEGPKLSTDFGATSWLTNSARAPPLLLWALQAL